MSKAFFLTSTHNNALIIDQLHVNLWFLTCQKMFIEIGLLLDVDKNFFQTVSNFELFCYTPFATIENSITELSQKLRNEDTLQLLFNDNLDSIINATTTPGIGTAHVVRFHSNNRFVLIRPILELEKSNSRFRISINMDGANKEIFNNEFQASICIKFYVRFRYQIDVKNSSNLFMDKRMFHDLIHFDFRFNEPRLFIDNIPNIYKELIPIKDIFVFTVEPTYCKVALETNANRKYVRLFEKEREGWKSYFEDLDSQKNAFLVYHWKTSLPATAVDNHFNMLVSFEIEKVDITRQLYTSLTLILISFAFIIAPQYINISLISGINLSYIQSVVKAIGGIGLAVALGITANALYDYIKEAIRDRFSNRN